MQAAVATQQTACKDVVALAFPLKAVPSTLEGFKQALADNSKGHDFVISNWYTSTYTTTRPLAGGSTEV
jgi:hypothetical protein